MFQRHASDSVTFSSLRTLKVRGSDRIMKLVAATSIVFVLTVAFAVTGYALPTQAEHQAANVSGHSGEHAARDGQAIFRFDTFGDEQLWTDVLRMHEVIATVDRQRLWPLASKLTSRRCRRRLSRRFEPEKSI